MAIFKLHENITEKIKGKSSAMESCQRERKVKMDPKINLNKTNKLLNDKNTSE